MLSQPLDVATELRRLGTQIESQQGDIRRLDARIGSQHDDIHRLGARIESQQGDIRHLGVLIEAQGDQIRTIAEQYGSIRETLDEHTKTLAIHTEMIGTLAVDMTIVKEDVAEIRKTLETKADKKDFAALDRRVVVLENRP